MAVSFSSEVCISAEPEFVFAAMINFEQWRHWMQGLVSIQQLTSGDFGVGTKWKETRMLYGRQASELFEVTSCVPARSLGLAVDGSKGTTGRGGFRFNYELGPANRGTRLQMTGSIVMPGFFSNLMRRMTIGTFKKACARDLTAMKAFLERPKTQSAG